MAIVKTSSKCQIVIPKEVRKTIGLKPGQRVEITAHDKKAFIVPLPQDPIRALTGIFKDHPTSLADELLEERRRDNKKDEKDTL